MGLAVIPAGPGSTPGPGQGLQQRLRPAQEAVPGLGEREPGPPMPRIRPQVPHRRCGAVHQLAQGSASVGALLGDDPSYGDVPAPVDHTVVVHGEPIEFRAPIPRTLPVTRAIRRLIR